MIHLLFTPKKGKIARLVLFSHCYKDEVNFSLDSKRFESNFTYLLSEFSLLSLKTMPIILSKSLEKKKIHAVTENLRDLIFYYICKYILRIILINRIAAKC